MNSDPFTIPHRYLAAPVYTTTTASTLRDAVVEAVGKGACLRDANLSDAWLSHAGLRGADLRGAWLSHAGLRDADLSGADLRGADLRGADLRGAWLSHAGLRGADLRGAWLSHAGLRDADLSGADLRGADLRGACLRDACLRGAKADGVPTIAHIHQAVRDAIQAPGCALDMDTWHTCETTHCRAGWVIHIAGAAGKALEEQIGPAAAAALIYHASDPSMDRVPDFHCSDDDAMADIIACAEKEAAS